MPKLTRNVIAILCLTATATVQAAATSQRIAKIAGERCEACHGQGGQGNNAMFPKLSGQNASYLVQQMFNFKSGVRKSSVMEPQLADLSGDDIVQLAAHFSALPLQAGAKADPDQNRLGREIYLRGNPATGVTACAACHGTTARGAHMLPRLAGQHGEYLELQLRRFIERSRTTDQTLMHSVASRLSEREIRAVSSFLSALE